MADATGGHMLIRADAGRMPLADRAVSLTLGSPPYMDARTYGIGAQRDCLDWVAWMLGVTAEAQRVTDGPVVWIAAGVTRDRNYWPGCEGLMWEWWKRGGECQLYRPCFWYRSGIPGSGGDDWFRADVEYAMCFKRSGKLPWSDNTVMGHVPKWAPGGAMSYRLADGQRVSLCGVSRRQNGRRKGEEPSEIALRKHTKSVLGDVRNGQVYVQPQRANPGNLIRVPVGGGLIGNDLAHENEAPYPEALAEFFIRSLCKPGGICFDPFSGSGTTASVACRLGRHAIGGDLRQSQCELGGRRIAEQLLDFHRPHRARPKAKAGANGSHAGQPSLFGDDA